MAGQLPPIGSAVDQAGGLPPIGGEVTTASPMFRADNARDDRGNPLVDFATEATASINPKNLYHALKSVVFDLPGTVKQIGAAQGNLFTKAEQSYKDGDYVAAARHMVNYLLPLIGPRLDQAGDFMQQGQYAKGLGATADIGVQMVLPKVGGKIRVPIKPALSGPANPAEAAAVRFGESRGVPMDAGTATGSQFLKNVQKRVGSTWGGANTAENAQRASQEGLTRVGNDLATQANAAPPGASALSAGGGPQSPVSAGESVRNALTKQIEDLHQTATAAYGKLRAAEQQQAARIATVGGVRGPATAHAPFTDVPLAVDIAPTKAALKPTYDRLMREAQIAPPMGGKARALQALDRIMSGPDVAPLSVVDDALGDLKAMARGAEMPELRTGGQAVAAQAVKELDARVRAAAQQAGPDVLKALEEGRAATTQKYVVADALDLFGSEPRQVFNQLTARKDLGLTKLRTIQRLAPDQLPTVARGLLEDMLDTATAEGGFGHTDKLWADWQRLGPLTKKTLFPQPGQVQALDNFFLLAKKLGQNPNPSGTAATLNATQALAGIPAWGVAKLLYTPTGVKALTRGIGVPVNTSPAARAFAAAQIARVAQMNGIPLAVPAAAEGQPTRQQTGAAR